MTLKTVVIVGAGHGGFQTAASLRQNGFDGRIVLIGDEPGLPYQRPPLSKAYLQGKMSLDRLWIRPENFFRDQRIELLPAEPVDEIEPAFRRVRLRSGASFAYDHLVLATGARNRLLPVPGAELDGVYYVRTLAETDALRARMSDVRHAVVIGAGFIGLEFASVACASGIHTTVLEMADRPMGRSLTREMSAFFAAAHERAGARLLFGAQAAAIHGKDGRASGVTLADGREVPADLVIVSVGIVPNTELAQAAGLEVANGIVVDSQMRTGNPDISAIGDCAWFPCVQAGGMARLESIQNAVDQARCVADRLTGKSYGYTSMPWFWSDQGPLKLQIVGLSNEVDRTVVRGMPEQAAFSLFCYAGPELVAIESVNRPADHMFGRRYMGQSGVLSPEQAGDLSFDLKQHAAGLSPVSHSS